MSTTYTQDTRRLAIDTPLGKDVLLLTAFHGQEEMSRLFSFDLDLRSEKDGLEAKDLVGKSVTFSVEYPDDSKRYFNGFINSFSYLGRGDRLSIYRAKAVPWLWFLTQASDCRIFQNKSIPDVIKQVFSDLGYSDYSFELQGNHPKWEYCVQYRETDFNFVSRLMEHEGIFYFFRHEEKKHTLVMADQKNAYKDCKEKEVDFIGPLAAPDLFNGILQWEHRHDYRSGKWTQTDYNFETPSNNLLVSSTNKSPFTGADKLEIFDHPGEYEKKPDGDGDVRLRMEEEELNQEVISGESVCRSFGPGFKFKLKKHHSQSESGKGYVLTATRHAATGTGTYVSGGDTENSYSNQFTCIPDNTSFRPARLTPKPYIHGAQSALVVGPSGEEIYTDKYGRVKVQFYWDRQGKKDENSSCWIRVAQSSAGKGWGTMFIPRIGQEVLVSYLEGDPDRPLITAVIHNAEQMPAYTLPDEKTRSYIKTNSTKGGNGFNELRFDDKKDNEQIFVHAQKNMDTRILNNAMTNVVGNQYLTVGKERDGNAGDRMDKIWRDEGHHVLRNSNNQVEGNYYHTVGFGGAANGGMSHLSVEKDQYDQIGQNHHSTVTQNRVQVIGQDRSVTVSGNQYEQVGQNHGLEAGTNVHIKAGMTLILEAGMQISLKVGGNFVDIGPAGVSIQGTMVLINSGGAPGSGTGAQVTSATAPQQAQITDPTAADDAKTGQKSAP